MTIKITAKYATALSLLLLTLAVGCTRSVPDRISGGSAGDVGAVVDAFVADAVGASVAQIPEPTGFGTITGKITVTGRVAI